MRPIGSPTLRAQRQAMALPRLPAGMTKDTDAPVSRHRRKLVEA